MVRQYSSSCSISSSLFLMRVWVLALLLFMTWAASEGRLLSPESLTAQAPFLLPEKLKQTQGGEEAERNGGGGEVEGLGSRPPRCHYKCGSCTPCVAIQVPTTNGHWSPEYANYEPEGWKCKCGSSFFNP